MDLADLSKVIDQFDSSTLTPEQLFGLAVPLVQRLNSGDEPKIAWCLAIAILAELNEIEMSFQLLSAAAGKFEHPAILCCQICDWLLRDRKYQAIANIHGGASADSIPRFISSYYMACVSFAKDNPKEAFTYLETFRQTPAALRDLLLVHHDLNIMFRQGCLVRPPDHIDALLAAPPAVPFSRMDFVRTAIPPGGGERPIFMCSADKKYLNALLRRFLDELPNGPADIILVAVNIDADDMTLIDELRSAHPQYRIDVVAIDSEHRNATFYACARFYALQAILPRYRRPVVSLDIDCVLTIEGRHLLEQPFPDVDFACYRSTRDEPASYFQAGIMYWAATPQAREFLDLVCLFCAERAAENSRVTWMLDQAALFSVLYYAHRRKRGLRFVPLNQLTGKTLPEMTIDTWDGPASKGNLRGVSVSSTQAGLIFVED